MHHANPSGVMSAVLTLFLAWVVSPRKTRATCLLDESCFDGVGLSEGQSSSYLRLKHGKCRYDLQYAEFDLY